jgi:hemoglobin
MDSPLYEQVGGEPFFIRLVDAFYVGVESDGVLRAMYPDDLTESKRHLVLFLMQYWGGPPTYMQERGHPRLRMRHAPFLIDKRARDAWLVAMNAGLDTVREELSKEQYEEMRAYFDMAAHQMRNV